MLPAENPGHGPGPKEACQAGPDRLVTSAARRQSAQPVKFKFSSSSSKKNEAKEPY